MNCMNDVQRDTIDQVMKTLETKELLTDEIKDVLTEMLASVKTNKKVVKKEKKPRFSGYHLFMKEHRVVVKKDQPGIKPQDLTTIVSKAWKDIPEDEKAEFNARALKMKEEYMQSSDTKSDNNKSSSDEAESSNKKKPAKKEKKKPAEKKQKKPVAKKTEKKEKKEKKPAEKKTKKTKKPVSPPSSDDESDDNEVNIHIEDAESDIDIWKLSYECKKNIKHTQKKQKKKEYISFFFTLFFIIFYLLYDDMKTKVLLVLITGSNVVVSDGFLYIYIPTDTLSFAPR